MRELKRFAAGLCLGLCFTLVSTHPAHADLDTKKQQHHALGALIAEIETHYGLIRDKQRDFPGVDTDSLLAKYSAKIEAGLTPEEFRKEMNALAAEFKDGHTNHIDYTSMDVFTLGIEARVIQGRLYIVDFDPRFYVQGQTSKVLKKGDEIIEINGRKVQDVATENMRFFSLATYDSQFMRSLESVVKVPTWWIQGPKEGESVTLKFKRGTKEITGRFNWVNYESYRRNRSLAKMGDFNEHFDTTPKGAPRDEAAPFRFGDRGTKSFFSEGLRALKDASEITNIGLLINTEAQGVQAQIKKAKADQDDTKVNELGASSLSEIKPVTRLEIYTVIHKGKRLGILRIPSYSPGNFDAVLNELRWTEEGLKRLEKNVDALIIDQVHNGGGYVYYFMELLRFFANDGAMKTQTIDMKLSHALLEALDAWADVPTQRYEDYETERSEAKRSDRDVNDPHEMNFAKFYLNRKHVDELREKYRNGERWSGPVPFGTTANHQPGEIGEVHAYGKDVFTKPVLFLYDSRSASGGDFTPRGFKDSGRATLMGEPSMALGAPVFRNTTIPGSETFFRCAFGSCTFKNEKRPLENVPPVPDVERFVTVEDLKEGFKPYAADTLDAAIGLVKGDSKRKINAMVQKRVRRRLGLKGAKAHLNFTNALGITTAYNKHTIESDKAGSSLEELVTVKEFNPEGALASESQMTEFEAGIKAWLPMWRKLVPTLAREMNASTKPAKKGATALDPFKTWQLIDVRLPKQLTDYDVILSVLTRRDEVMVRLEELTRLKRLPKPVRRLAMTILNGMKKFDGPVRIRQNCEAFL